MPIDIEQKSRELKEYVSVYDTKTFLGDLSTLLLMVPMQHLPESIIGLVAPQRQIFYLAGLHLTSEKKRKCRVKISIYSRRMGTNKSTANRNRTRV